MLNKIVLMGRLTRDPELRRTQQGTAVASFSLAVDRDYKAKGTEKETDFIDIVAWRNTAEFVSKYFSKPAATPIKKAITAERPRSWPTTSISAIARRTAIPAMETTERQIMAEGMKAEATKAEIFMRCPKKKENCRSDGGKRWKRRA